MKISLPLPYVILLLIISILAGGAGGYYLATRQSAVLGQSVRLLTNQGCVPLIERGTKLPASASHTFTNQEDGQAAVGIYLYQGEAVEAERNRLIGSSELPIKPSDTGSSRVQLTVLVGQDRKVTLAMQSLDTGERKEVFVGIVE